MSLTIIVPAAVPSDFHSSVPPPPSAVKNRVPFTLVRLLGFQGPGGGREEQRAVHFGQVGRGVVVGIVAAVSAIGSTRIDVLDEGGAGNGAVRLPQLRAMDAIVSREEQRAVYFGQTVGVRAGGA